MHKLFLQIALASYLLGSTICPCIAAPVVNQADEHQHHAAMHHESGDRLMPDCHGQFSNAACIDNVSGSASMLDAAAGFGSPSPDDEAHDAADTDSGAYLVAHHGGAPPLHDRPRPRPSPVTLQDRLTE